MAKMSKEMPIGVFSKKIGIDKKEQEWIEKNDKGTHYYNNSALKSEWLSLSYPIYDGDYYFAFINKKARVNAQYNAKANRELRKYITSTLDADEIFEKMSKYFAMQFKDAGSGDTMTREELWRAIVDMRQKNPVKEEVSEDYKKVIKMYPRDNDWKKLITKHKKAIDDFRNEKRQKDLPKKVEDELVDWAATNGEIGHKDDVEDFIQDILDEETNIFNTYRQMNHHQQNTFNEAAAEEMIDKLFKLKGNRIAGLGVAMLLNMTDVKVAQAMQKQNPQGFMKTVNAMGKETGKIKPATEKEVMKMFKKAGVKPLPEETISENYRTLARKGMGAETKKSIKVGREVDYYEPKQGNKRQGKVVKLNNKGYTVQDDQDRKTHTFVYHDRVAAKKLLAASNEFDKNPLKGFPYNEETNLTETKKQEVDAMKKISKDMQSVLKAYQKVSTMGDKTLKDTKHNASYKKVLDARDAILTMIGTLNTQMLLTREETNLWAKLMTEEMITYRVKKMQKPELDKFQKSAKMMRLKLNFDQGKDDTVLVVSGSKKKLRDFDSVVRGKSSYGDPSTIKHFDEK